MQGFEYKYNIDNKDKELKELEEGMLAKRKEVEQLEAKITQIQKDSQKKLKEAENTIFSLKSDNTNAKMQQESQRLERAVKELERKVEDREEEIKGSKRNQEQLLSKIEELEEEAKKLKEEESTAQKKGEQLRKDQQKLSAEHDKLVERVREKEQIIKELREARGGMERDNSASQDRMKRKMKGLIKRARQYKASLLREH